VQLATWLVILFAAGCSSVLGIDSDYVLADGSAGSAAAGHGGGGSSGTGGSGGTGGATGPTNVVLAANGATIESFTSEYCNPDNLPTDCLPDYWSHANINDGDHAQGSNPNAFRAAWASAAKGGQTTAEEFVFSFSNGMSARIGSVTLQNYGEEPGNGPYYATHVVLHAEPPGGGAWSEILNVDLAENEEPQVFDLVAINGSEAEAGRLRLTITAGVDSDYWDLGEFEAWGYLF